MNEPEVQQMLAILTSVWDNVVIDKLKVKGYCLALAPFPAPAVMAAATKHMQRSRFFPMPADLLALIVESLPETSTGEAWELVQRQIRFHGFHGWEKVSFEDRTIMDAVKAVTWKRLCLDDNSQGYVRRDFELVFKAAQERTRHSIQAGDFSALAGGPDSLALSTGASS